MIRFFSTDGSARFWEVWKWPFAIRYSRILYAGELTPCRKRFPQKLGHTAFKTIRLFSSVRSPMPARIRLHSNERLEFLGDRVLAPDRRRKNCIAALSRGTIRKGR